jgi:hypothetical protein
VVVFDCDERSSGAEARESVNGLRGAEAPLFHVAVGGVEGSLDALFGSQDWRVIFMFLWLFRVMQLARPWKSGPFRAALNRAHEAL